VLVVVLASWLVLSSVEIAEGKAAAVVLWAWNPGRRLDGTISTLPPLTRAEFVEGRVEQRNFDGFTPPYIADAPVTVDVHIVPSTEAPTGVGEPPVPVISPAVVNALARLTGKRYRTLPLVTI